MTPDHLLHGRPRLRQAARVVLPACILLLSACHGHRTGEEKDGRTIDGTSARAFDHVADNEMLHMTGTEPFWSATAEGGRLVWATPEKPAGTTIAVRRFSGNNGMGLSGTLDGQPVDVAVSKSACSDGMSDRTYPFAVTVRIGAEERTGCGWTQRMPFTGPAKP